MPKRDNKYFTHQSNLLSKKITAEYVFRRNEYPSDATPSEIIRLAYKKASELFCVDSETSIITQTFSFYMDNVEEALESFISDKKSFEALSVLLMKYIKNQVLITDEKNTLQKRFTSELLDNKDYYTLFNLEYFIELSNTEGVDAALAELESDVNIRAATYFRKAYNTYLDMCLLNLAKEIFNEYFCK